MAHDQVLKWLSETGFPLEMTAAAAFRSAGFEVRQSTTYADATSGKGREIDVLAQDPDFWGVINISVVAECKSSSKPWVVLVADDVLAGYNRLRAFAVMSDAALTALHRGRLEDLTLLTFMHDTGRAGYALRQAFSKDVDPAYAAALNLMAGCRGVIPEEALGSWPVFAVVIPVLVVDAPIFECELSGDGQLKLTEVEHSSFLFTAHLPKQTDCAIRVTSKRYLPKLAETLAASCKALRADLKPEEEKVFQSWRESTTKRE